MKKLSLLFAFLLTLFGGTQAWADELTVYDETNTTNKYVPFYGYYGDEVQKNQMIFPADVLEGLKGKNIVSMTFYCNSFGYSGKGDMTNWIVSLGETEANTLNNLDTETNLSQVFSGTITPNTTDKIVTITFDLPYSYLGSNLLVEFNHPTASGYYDITFKGIEVPSAAYTYNASRNFLPRTTFGYEDIIEGPGLAVFDGNSKLATGHSYNFGLATAGTEKAFTLKNPGTESVAVNIAATGGYGVSPTTATIAAGGEATLTVTMSETTGEGTVTITPTTTGVDAFTINVSGTVRDADKVYESGFTALPQNWSTTGTWNYSEANGAYTTAWYLSSNARLITPKLTIAEGEKFFVEAKGYSTSNTSYQHLQMQYSADGTTWTNFDAEPTLDPSDWNIFEFTGAPAGNYYIAINASQADIRMFYGGKLYTGPQMDVTQPASLDFGVISETATKTFTIANTGKAALEGITVSCDNPAFTITNTPTSLAASASQEVTITMSSTTVGNFSGTITVSAPDQTTVEFTVTGTVLPTGLTVIDFNDNKIPNDRWTAEGNYMSFSGGAAVFGYNSNGNSAVLTTPKVLMGDYLVVKAKLDYNGSSYHLTVKGSTDNGETYTYTKKFGNDVMATDYQYFLLSDIPANVNKLQFVGYYASIDEIQGINYAPELAVTLDGETVASSATYDFGECNADATVTYKFANIGEGELSITGVAITGAGAAAYSTNFVSAMAVPAKLEITRTYNAERNGAQDATITVTTTDGDFVINVTGTDRAANAPELDVDVETLDFGKLAANDTKTVTVTNAGTGKMTVTIASDNELFSVSPAQLTDIGAGESKTFDVTFNYTSMTENYGAQNATITVTPTYDGGTAKAIAATAIAKDPAVWSEDFANDPTTDRGWTADNGWSFSNGVAVGGGSGYLTTPYLSVNGTSDELTFEYEGTGTSSWGFYLYYSVRKYGEEWPTSNSYSEIFYPGDKKTFTIKGLEAGVYQIRIKGGSYNLDNFEGFKLFVPEHDAEITAINIPANGYVGMEYTATVTVKEKMNKAEAATATLYIANTAVATKEVTLTANGETDITLAYTPSEAVSYQAAKIEVTYAGGTLNSESKYVTIKNVTVLDETQENTIAAGNMVAVLLKRQFIAGWNSLCLPFAVTSPKTVFGDDVKAYTFDSYNSTDGLGFKAVNLSNGLDAGTPYLLYLPAAITDDLFFESVSTTANMRPATNGNVTFQGTYTPITAGNLPAGSYVLTPEARIAKAGSNASLKAFRAYFTTTGEARMTINFDDNTTAIGAITTDGELEVGTLYNLKGQKVKGNQKGLYIINGKKVVVK